MEKISVTEAAKITGYSVPSVYRLVEERRFTSYQPTGPRGKIWLDKEEVEQFITSSKRKKEVSHERA